MLCIQRSVVLLLLLQALILMAISKNAGEVYKDFEVNISDDSLLRAIAECTSLLLVNPRQLSLFFLPVQLITG